jgi:universal stress protein E
VLLVKTAARSERPVLLAAVDPVHRSSRTTRLDAEILSISRALGTALRGTVHAMHAYMPIPIGVPSDDWAAPGVFDEIQDQLKENARAVLDQALGRSDIPRSRRHVVGYPAGLAIPDTASATGAAIVVMGSVSRSGLKAALVGNTAERALDNIACDVLVVKPRLFVDRVPARVRGPRLAAMAATP